MAGCSCVVLAAALHRPLGLLVLLFGMGGWEGVAGGEMVGMRAVGMGRLLVAPEGMVGGRGLGWAVVSVVQGRPLHRGRILALEGTLGLRCLVGLRSPRLGL